MKGCEMEPTIEVIKEEDSPGQHPEEVSPESLPLPRIVRCRRVFAALLLWSVVLAASAWAALALWFDCSRNPWGSGSIATVFLALCLSALVRVRPASRALAVVSALVIIVVTWWNLIPPSNDRNWSPEVARLTRFTATDSQLTIQNVRNFDYRSEKDYTEHWETRSYDLDKLRGVDLFISNWGPKLIVHTIASWEFADGRTLAISIETRKEKGESYSAVRGLFRQYELYYVVADERDVIRLRTNFRGERVFLYRLRVDPKGAKAMLLDYLKEVNRLAEKPRWYNALTHNCTTTIRHHALHVGEGNPWDWRILVNGYIDELGYERGMFDTSMPPSELKACSEITEKAKTAGAAPEFTARIREGLPSPWPTDGSTLR